MTLPSTTVRVGPGLRRILLAVLLLNLFIFTLIGLVLDWNLQHQRDKATLAADNFGRVLEENLARFIDKIDLTLLAVADEAERQERGGGIDRPKFEAFLARHDSRLPEALGLRVVNADGIVEYAVSNVQGNPRINIADRVHFTGPRDNPQMGLFISDPIVGRLSPQPMIILARRRHDHEGRFTGTVHVAVSVASLARMFSAIDIGSQGSVGLWNDRPILLTRYSLVAGPISGAATPSAAFRQLVADRAPPTAYSTRSGVDGIERIFFYRRVGAWPLSLVVGLSAEDFLAGWRREAAYLVGLGLIFTLASIAAALTIHRAMRAQERARAEAVQARQRSDLVLASVGDGICGIDLQGRVTFVNDAARRMLGWSEGEGVGCDLHMATHHHRADGRDYPAAECPMRLLLSEDRALPAVRVEDEVYWRRDGTCFPVEYSGSPLVQAGQVVGAVNIFRDISERRAAEAAMARNLATTEVLAACLSQSLTDRSLADILDFALGRLLELPWLKLQSRGSVFILEEGHLRMAAQRNLPGDICAGCAKVAVGHCLCGRAAAGAELVFADCIDDRHETRHEGMGEHGHYCVPIMAAGEVLGVLNTYIAAHHRRDGEEERFLHMFTDTLAGIIKRKRVEQILRDSEELAKTLMNATIDAAFLMSPDGIILAANQALASRFGTHADDLVGRSFFSIIPPALALSRRKQFDEVLATRLPMHIQDERDGRVMDNRIYPVVDPDGTISRVAVFSRDITAQRAAAAAAVEKAMEDLERSNRELEQFAYVASHDMRQPLRMISSYLGLIERKLGADLPGEIKDFIGYAVGGARRMDALILGLLEYSRVGRGEPIHQTVDLADVVADALSNLEIAIQESGTEIRVSDQPAAVFGDRSELVRLVQNLIGNAVKYRAPDRPPKIRIDWQAAEDGWQVQVADNGTGIAAEDHERAFGIFQRLVQSDSVEGTGIGLAVCRKIVEHHGGRIWIESEPGRGSTFLFTLKGTPGA